MAIKHGRWTQPELVLIPLPIFPRDLFRRSQWYVSSDEERWSLTTRSTVPHCKPRNVKQFCFSRSSRPCVPRHHAHRLDKGVPAGWLNCTRYQLRPGRISDSGLYQRVSSWKTISQCMRRPFSGICLCTKILTSLHGSQVVRGTTSRSQRTSW